MIKNNKFSFFAGKYGNDANATLNVEISYDGGSTWIQLESISINNADFVEYQYDITQSGYFRIKLSKSGGKRINIDDIKFSYIPG